MACIVQDYCLLPKKVCYKYPEYINFKTKEKKGCLFAHIQYMLKMWEKFKKRYLPCLTRILNKLHKIDESLTDILIKIMIILHDYGKIAQEYYEEINSKKYHIYYHEILSSCITYDFLRENTNKKLASVVAAAILLHHEHRFHRILKHTWAKVGYNLSKVIEEITRKYLPDVIHVENEANEMIKKLIKNLWKNKVNYSIFATEYKREKLMKTLKSLCDIIRTYRSMLAIGALNHVLVILDIRAAHYLRKDRAREISRYFKTVLTGGRLII